MSRDEHLEWCKARAREYLDHNDPRQAVTSMLSDLGKHEETREMVEKLGMVGLMSSSSIQDARRFIEGFN